MRKVIVLVGSSSTGKTTAFDLLRTKLTNYSFISESTRKVQNYGFKINEDGNDSTQLAITAFHLRTLLNPGNLILDRGLLDVLVYSNSIEGISDSTKSFIQDTFSEVKNDYTHIIYFPIEFNAVDDGVRSVNEVWRRNIDDSFRSYLDHFYGNNYLTVSGSPMQRIQQILDYI